MDGGARFARILVGNGDVLFVCRYLRRRRILREVVGTERADVVGVDAAYYPGRIGVFHKLIVVVETFVEFVDVGVVVLFVEYGRFRPVAVEGKEGNVHIDGRAALCGEGDEAFDVHTVFEGSVDVIFILVGQGYLHRYFCRGICGDGYRFAVLRAADDSRYHRSCAVK